MSQSCESEATACAQDDCAKILTCAQTMDLQLCGRMYPGGVDSYNAIIACARTSCASQCQK